MVEHKAAVATFKKGVGSVATVNGINPFATGQGVIPSTTSKRIIARTANEDDAARSKSQGIDGVIALSTDQLGMADPGQLINFSTD
ncbi:hypothetical protein DSLASN_18180 [Desulfoluna limicola]|uniref:Uncharacterized protein n=1 Tax=Desulfoluna limicola TaxID=2810562 RepID=A0ABN6F3X3_9BACT|nr:hypothetical protein DSLASN_18180 [Desulfoluna limicola]